MRCPILGTHSHLLCLFDPLAEGGRGDALPVPADEREETLGGNSIRLKIGPKHFKRVKLKRIPL